MKPLFVLLVTFWVILILLRILNRQWQISFSGKIAMSIMLIFTSIGHFLFTDGMMAMIPSFVPFPKFWVLFTGILEILFAILIQFKLNRKKIGWILIIFFVLLLPMNIYAAIHHINYQTGETNGHGINYLWFRVPLQFLFIFWTYFFIVVPKKLSN